MVPGYPGTVQYPVPGYRGTGHRVPGTAGINYRSDLVSTKPQNGFNRFNPLESFWVCKTSILKFPFSVILRNKWKHQNTV